MELSAVLLRTLSICMWQNLTVTDLTAAAYWQEIAECLADECNWMALGLDNRTTFSDFVALDPQHLVPDSLDFRRDSS